ncbi:MAG: DoxX family protein [Nitrososphaera sp.]|uniref:DoxX family protein n=1 Tax=Nitrososphaera sp. TaxID=1971748 RepID=UPI003D6EF70B
MNTKLATFGPLPIRILAGAAFIAHGLPKFANPAGTAGFFSSVGIPRELALPIGVLEVVGGAFLLAGFMTRVASTLLAIEMVLVTIIVKASRGFVGGYELELLLMSIAISLVLTGPGRVSIEWDVIKREIWPGKKVAAAPAR